MGHLNLIEWENAPWFRSSLTTNSSQVRIGEVWLRTFPRRSNEIPVFKDLTHFNNSEYCPRLFRDIVWTRLLLRRDRKFGLTGKLHSFLISDYCVIKIETRFLNLHVKYIYIYIKALYVEIWLDMRLCKILLSVCKTWKKIQKTEKNLSLNSSSFHAWYLIFLVIQFEISASQNMIDIPVENASSLKIKNYSR